MNRKKPFLNFQRGLLLHQWRVVLVSGLKMSIAPTPLADVDFKLDLSASSNSTRINNGGYIITFPNKYAIKIRNMKKSIITILLLFSIIIVNAQEWQTDLNKSMEMAKEKSHNIILVFQGSDWCAPCIKLEKQIWSSDEFKAYAKDNFVLLKADFPRKKKNRLSKEQQEKNNQLAEKYNIHGYFPLVIVLNQNGKVLKTTGYKNVTPTEYIKILNSF